VVSITTETPNTRIDKCLVCHSSTLQENHIEDFGDFPVYGANGICGYTVNADFKEPAILIVKDGSGVGNVRFVNGKYSVIGTQNILTPQNRFCLKYIFYCLQAFNFMPYKTGMAIPHIYFKDYGKSKIYCPNFEQQVKIASQIDLIESKIEIETQLLNKYEEQKKFLLSNMFI
jgi:type I restriction enzyme S subunit